MATINFSGLASGIDSSSLISALLDQQRKARIDPLQKRIDEFTKTKDSFSKLDDLLNKFSSSLQKLRSLNGSALTKVAGSSNESVATATASNSAVNSSYNVTVSQLAKNGTYSFNDRFSSSSSIINASINNGSSSASRTITVETGLASSKETVAIEITNSTTLSDFVSQFNAQSSSAEASVVNTGTSSSPSYGLIFNSKSSGTALGTVAVSVGSEITTAGGLNRFTTHTLSQATDAEFTLDGIDGSTPISRGTNSISDVIPGVTLALKSTGSVAVSVSDDAESSAANIQAVVDSFNEIRKYISENDAITQKKSGSDYINVFGSLANTSLDENILSGIRSAISQSSISGGTINTLADLGITTERDGSLKFNTDTFNSALSSDPESVRSITQNFGETLGKVDGTIAQYTRFNGNIDIASRSLTDQISSYEKRIGDVERSLSKMQATLQAQYSRLESVIGSLQSQQSALGTIATK